MINKIQLEEFLQIYNLLSQNIKKLYNKSFLITGATGLIGSYWVEFLLFLNQEYNANIRIFALSRKKENLEKRFPKQDNLIFLEQDLNTGLEINVKTDFIIHAASNAHPIAFSINPVETMKTNLLGTMNLLELARKNNSQFLFLSTGEIYGNNVDKAFVETDCGYVDTKLVRSCYPESKRCAETLCMAYKDEYKVNVNIARLCYIYGAGITDENSRADAQFLRNALNKENIVLKSEGSQKRSYCYIADCISGQLFIILNAAGGEVFNISNPNSVISIKEYAQTLANLAGVELKYEIPNKIEKKGFSKQADSILSSEKLMKLGWQPLYDIIKGLNHTFYGRK